MQVAPSFYQMLIAASFVGLGGFLGAAARYLVTVFLVSSESLPIATILVNVIGCLFIGVFAALVDGLSTEGRLFLITGLCGGFTTYSSIILELSNLIKAGAWFQVASYSTLTLVGGFAAFFIGFMLTAWLKLNYYN